MSQHDPDAWPRVPPLATPPASLEAALTMRLVDLARCYIETRCGACNTVKAHPIQRLLSDRPQRAKLPLSRAVMALLTCSACRRLGCELALVSDPLWRTSQAAGGPPNWGLVLTGRQRGAVAFSDPEHRPCDRENGPACGPGQV